MKTPPVQLDHLHVFGLESGSTQSKGGGGFPLPPSRFHHTFQIMLFMSPLGSTVTIEPAAMQYNKEERALIGFSVLHVHIVALGQV